MHAYISYGRRGRWGRSRRGTGATRIYWYSPYELLGIPSSYSDPNIDLYKNLFKNYVIEYYTAILNDFINYKLIIGAINILHLATIPGAIFAGQQGEKNISEYMREAILKFVEEPKTKEIVYIVADLEEIKTKS